MSDTCSYISSFSNENFQSELLITLLGFITVGWSWWKDMFVYPVCTYGGVGFTGSMAFGIGQIHGGAYILQHWDNIIRNTSCKYFDTSELTLTNRPSVNVHLVKTDKSHFFTYMDNHKTLWTIIDIIFFIIVFAQASTLFIMSIVIPTCGFDRGLGVGTILLFLSNVINWVIMFIAGRIRRLIANRMFRIVRGEGNYVGIELMVVRHAYNLEYGNNANKYGKEMLKAIKSSGIWDHINVNILVGLLMILSGVLNFISIVLILASSKQNSGQFVSLITTIVMIFQIIGQRVNAGIWNPNSLD